MTTSLQRLPNFGVINVVSFPTFCACTNKRVRSGFPESFVFSPASLTSDVSALRLHPAAVGVRAAGT